MAVNHARHVGRLARRALVLGALMLTVFSLFVPVAAFFAAQDNGDVLDQLSVDPARLDGPTRAQAGQLAASAGSTTPLILSYHDIRPLAPDQETEDVYTITPERFAEHMAALKAAGLHAISSAQLAGWLDGKPLPRHSVFITFDDGASGVWRYADSVLKRYHLRGAVFVITGRAGTHRPYYLSWNELRRLGSSGRWDVESHTRLGHDRIAIDANGDAAPFLINRAWLRKANRAETLDETVKRVSADIARSRTDLRVNGFVKNHFFAYPFSAETKPTNDDRLPPAVAKVIAKNFAGGLSNDEPDRFASQRDRARRSLSRMEVFRFTTAADLLQRIGQAVPLRPEGLHPLEQPDQWVDSSGRPLAPDPASPAHGVTPSSPFAAWAAFDRAGSMAAKPDPDRYLGAAFAPGRAEDWADYRVAVVAGDLGPAGQGATAGVSALEGSASPVQLSTSAGYARLRVADKVVAERPIPPSSSHHLEIDAAGGRVVGLIDGVEIGSAPVPATATGGVSLGASGTKPDGPAVRFTAMTVDALQPAPPRPARPARAAPPKTKAKAKAKSTTTTTTRPRRAAPSTTTTTTRRRTTTTASPTSSSTTSSSSSTTTSSSSTTSSTTSSSSTTSTTARQSGGSDD